MIRCYHLPHQRLTQRDPLTPRGLGCKPAHLHLPVVKVGRARLVLAVFLGLAKRPIQQRYATWRQRLQPLPSPISNPTRRLYVHPGPANQLRVRSTVRSSRQRSAGPPVVFFDQSLPAGPAPHRDALAANTAPLPAGRGVGERWRPDDAELVEVVGTLNTHAPRSSSVKVSVATSVPCSDSSHGRGERPRVARATAPSSKVSSGSSSRGSKAFSANTMVDGLVNTARYSTASA
jgi:hypothetical protein